MRWGKKTDHDFQRLKIIGWVALVTILKVGSLSFSLILFHLSVIFPDEYFPLLFSQILFPQSHYAQSIFPKTNIPNRYFPWFFSLNRWL